MCKQVCCGGLVCAPWIHPSSCLVNIVVTILLSVLRQFVVKTLYLVAKMIRILGYSIKL